MLTIRLQSNPIEALAWLAKEIPDDSHDCTETECGMSVVSSRRAGQRELSVDFDEHRQNDERRDILLAE